MDAELFDEDPPDGMPPVDVESLVEVAEGSPEPVDAEAPSEVGFVDPSEPSKDKEELVDICCNVKLTSSELNKSIITQNFQIFFSDLLSLSTPWIC